MIAVVHELLDVKSNNGFSGAIVVYFEKGSVVSVDKTQSMDIRRLVREVKRDSRAQMREKDGKHGKAGI